MRRGVAVLACVIAVTVGVWVFLKVAARGFSAKEQPTAIEKFAARSARRMAVPKTRNR